MGERNFDDVVNRIYSIGNQELNKRLETASEWAPTVRWRRLRGYVRLYVTPNYADWTCVRIYAALWGCTLKKAKQRLKKKAR